MDYDNSIELKNIIKKEVPLRKVFEHFGIEVLDGRGSEPVCLCPFHNERTPSCYLNEQENVFHCFGCKASGDIFTIVKHKTQLESWYQILEYLKETYKIDFQETETTRINKIKKQVNKLLYAGELSDNDKLNRIEKLSADISRFGRHYCQNRNWSPESLEFMFRYYSLVDKLMIKLIDKEQISFVYDCMVQLYIKINQIKNKEKHNVSH